MSGYVKLNHSVIQVKSRPHKFTSVTHSVTVRFVVSQGSLKVTLLSKDVAYYNEMSKALIVIELHIYLTLIDHTIV